VTSRLYFTDALEFDAVVASCAPSGDRFDVVLDRTAFYPESGGQPCDTGALGAARVLAVQDDDAGVIHHLTDTPLVAGAAVRGAIDWARRFDHMQQHTGQHILSAAFDRLCRVRTTSFHMGAEASTIDLAREVSPAEIEEALRGANRVVWEGRPVSVRFVTADEAARLPLRKEPVKTGPLRLVEVEGFDLSACGGTHVPQTGMVGAIVVSGSERVRGATRLAFACGARAVAAHGGLREVVAAATRALSVLPADLPPAILRLQAEVKAGGREIRRLHEELAGFRAAGLRASAETVGPVRGVLSTQAGADGGALKTLALAVVSEPGLAVVLTGDGRPVPVVAARSADVAWDAGAWMARAVAALGGRGGGRPELAQGGLDAAPDRVLAFARQAWRES
jgi:alanyl-tRNA synthetase